MNYLVCSSIVDTKSIKKQSYLYLTLKYNAVFNLMSVLLFSIYYSMKTLIATNLASELSVINCSKSTLTNLISNTEVISCLRKLFIEELRRFIHSYSSGDSETPQGTPVESVAFSKVLPGAKFTRRKSMSFIDARLVSFFEACKWRNYKCSQCKCFNTGKNVRTKKWFSTSCFHDPKNILSIHSNMFNR